MKIFLIVVSSILVAMSLLITVAMPVVGIIGALVGAAILVYGIRYKKPEKPEISPVNYQEEIRQPERHHHTILVAGFDYRQPALASLLTELNSDYDITAKDWWDGYDYDLDDRIYEYERAVYPVHLEAEPDNEHDQNAVKVFADDVFIGYLPRGSFPEVAEYSKIENVRIHVEIFGGRYKYLEDVSDGYSFEYTHTDFRVKTETSPVKAIIVFNW